MNLLWALAAGVLLGIAQGVLFKSRALKSIAYERSFDRRVARVGDEIELLETLSNNKLLMLPWLRVESRMSPNLRFNRQRNLDISQDVYHKSMFSMSGYRRIIRRHKLTCLRRGYYNLSSVTLTAGDLIGFAESHQAMELKCELVVLPELIAIEDIPIPIRTFMGDVRVRRFMLPDPILVAGVREYRPGDARRDIHWGASARAGAMMVKQREYTADPRLMLYLNVQISVNQWGQDFNDYERELIERGITYAASLTAWAHQRGMQVGFATNSEIGGAEPCRFEPSSSRLRTQAILEHMGRMITRRRISLTRMLEEEIMSGITGCDIIMLSAYVDEGMERQCDKLRRMGNTVQVLRLTGGARS